MAKDARMGGKDGRVGRLRHRPESSVGESVPAPPGPRIDFRSPNLSIAHWPLLYKSWRVETGLIVRLRKLGRLGNLIPVHGLCKSIATTAPSCDFFGDR